MNFLLSVNTYIPAPLRLRFFFFFLKSRLSPPPSFVIGQQELVYSASELVVIHQLHLSLKPPGGDDPPIARLSSALFASPHFFSKPSRMSVCIRAVSSTNLASTFSCSSNGFGAAGSQPVKVIRKEKNSTTSCLDF